MKARPVAADSVHQRCAEVAAEGKLQRDNGMKCVPVWAIIGGGVNDGLSNYITA